MKLLPITKEIRWFQLFGEKGVDIPEDIRLDRWEAWKALLVKDGEQEGVDYWSRDNLGECIGCKHKAGDWCRLVGLPCCVNPVLTFSFNHIGMACQGAGYNQDLEQGKLF